MTSNDTDIVTGRSGSQQTEAKLASGLQPSRVSVFTDTMIVARKQHEKITATCWSERDLITTLSEFGAHISDVTSGIFQRFTVKRLSHILYFSLETNGSCLFADSIHSSVTEQHWASCTEWSSTLSAGSPHRRMSPPGGRSVEWPVGHQQQAALNQSHHSKQSNFTIPSGVISQRHAEPRPPQHSGQDPSQRILGHQYSSHDQINNQTY